MFPEIDQKHQLTQRTTRSLIAVHNISGKQNILIKHSKLRKIGHMKTSVMKDDFFLLQINSKNALESHRAHSHLPYHDFNSFIKVNLVQIIFVGLTLLFVIVMWMTYHCGRKRKQIRIVDQEAGTPKEEDDTEPKGTFCSCCCCFSRKEQKVRNFKSVLETERRLIEDYHKKLGVLPKRKPRGKGKKGGGKKKGGKKGRLLTNKVDDIDDFLGSPNKVMAGSAPVKATKMVEPAVSESSSAKQNEDEDIDYHGGFEIEGV